MSARLAYRKGHNEADLVEKFLVVDHSEPDKRKPFGNLERRFMGFLRPSSLRESNSMVASVGFRWNSEARMDRGKFVSDITLHQWVSPEALEGGLDAILQSR